MTKTGNFLFFLILAFSFFARAATTVQSTVDRTEVGVGQSFVVTVSVISDKEISVQEPRIPELEGFELLDIRSSSSASQKMVSTPQGMQFQTQIRKDFYYTISSQQQGTVSVASFEVVVDGKVFQTKPIIMKVGAQPTTRGQGGGRQNQPPPEDPFESMDSAEDEIFNQLLRQRQRLMQQLPGMGGFEPQLPPAAMGMPEAAFRSLPTNPNEAFFISVEVDKTEVFEGEQVTANWYIYTRGQMETLDRLKFPSLRGFWKEIIEEVPSIQFMEEVVNGTPWKKALLASHALFPIKAGTAVIDEYKIKSRVRLLAQGMGGFYGKPFEYTKSSARVPIKVKPLPVENRPSDYSGAVGVFDVNAKVEATTVPVNQPFTLIVRFEGAGNAKLIDLPAMNLPTGLEQYESKSESKFFKNGRSYKEFQVLLIPRQEGEMIIPALSVGMFDPGTQKYYSKTTQPITLQVVNNPNAAVGPSSRMADLGGPAKSTPAVEKKLPGVITDWQPATSAQLMAQPWTWGLVYGGVLLALLVKLQKEFGFGRRRRTLKEQVQKRYKMVDAALAQSDYRKVGTEMTNTFYTVLGVASGSGGAAMEVGLLLEKVPPSLRRDHAEEIGKMFEVFQTMSFAPDEMLGGLKEPSAMKENVQRAKKVISAVIAAVDAE